MEKELIDLIKINRDAVSTNRGFYYQYLHVLLKWTNNFINSQNIDIYTEVDDDVKEVGEELIFTQLKCYSSVFSFNSPEIQKTLLNFFCQYLEYRNQIENFTFKFTTNTSLSRNEKLLKKWIDEQPLITVELVEQCTSKISQIIILGIDEIKKKLLNKVKLNSTEIKKIKNDFTRLNNIAQDDKIISDFICKISWEFGNEDPEVAIGLLLIKILAKLENSAFEQRPPKLLLDVMLSEIYRKSQLSDPKQRKVNNSILKSILDINDKELFTYVDKRLISLLDSRLEILESKVTEIKETLSDAINIQNNHQLIIEQIVQDSISKNIVVPHIITRIPYVDPISIIGREEMMIELHEILIDISHLSINGSGGMGKSTFLKLYVNKYKNEYDHLIWLNVESGLVNSIIANEQLAANINAPALERAKLSERFDLIIDKLNQIPGKNLLIIDSYDVLEPELSALKSLDKWQVLVGTRLRLENWKTISINALNFESAKVLYCRSQEQNSSSDELLSTFFNYVEYNTLIISLVAKTIYASFDLTLDAVLNHIKEQNLDSQNLQINLQNEYGESNNILNILNKTFSLKKIDSKDIYFLTFFALLPLEDTDFEDVVDWFGKEYETVNRSNLTNVINSLHEKGLIERVEKRITMHKMLRESILYQERKVINPFLSQFHNIVFLTMRIKEGADQSLSEAFRFLKFGESILLAIKEQYSRSIYQPILQLENEVLHIYNWINKEKDLKAKWQNLYERSEKYLLSNDSLLGIISNNYGLALANDGDLSLAYEYFEKAISILKSLDEKALSQLFISLCNLCYLFVEKKDILRFSECFQTLQDLRKKHDLWDDVSLSIQSQILGSFYYKIGNFPEAIKLLNIAINLHRELPTENKNDAYLVFYYIKLGESYLMNDELDKAEKASIIAINILSNIKAKLSGQSKAIIKLMISIAHYKGEEETVEKLKKIFEKLE